MAQTSFIFYFFFLLNYTVGEACEHLSLVMGISLYTTLELPIETENVLKKIFLNIICMSAEYYT